MRRIGILVERGSPARRGREGRGRSRHPRVGNSPVARRTKRPAPTARHRRPRGACRRWWATASRPGWAERPGDRPRPPRRLLAGSDVGGGILTRAATLVETAGPPRGCRGAGGCRPASRRPSPRPRRSPARPRPSASRRRARRSTAGGSCASTWGLTRRSRPARRSCARRRFASTRRASIGARGVSALLRHGRLHRAQGPRIPGGSVMGTPPASGRSRGRRGAAPPDRRRGGRARRASAAAARA